MTPASNPNTKAVQIEGFADLLYGLEKAPSISLPIVERAVEKSINILTGLLKPYPEETAANKPGRWREVKRRLKNGDTRVYVRPVGYYERHRGWWYPVMRKRTLGDRPIKARGAIAAKRARKDAGLPTAGPSPVAGYKLLGGGTSEFLGQSWTTALYTDLGGTSVTGEIGDNASYADSVQGPHGVQARRMADIGWVSVDDALEEAQSAIDAAFNEATDEFIKTLMSYSG